MPFSFRKNRQTSGKDKLASEFDSGEIGFINPLKHQNSEWAGFRLARQAVARRQVELQLSERP